VTALRDRHLTAVAGRLAHLLCGADDPAVFIGVPGALAGEIGRLFDLRLLRRAEGDGPKLSYRDVVATCAMPARPVAIERLDDAPLILLDGLSGPATLATAPRLALPDTTITIDVEALLRQPVLRFYVRTDAPQQFSDAIRAELPPSEVESIRPMAIGGGLALVASFNAARRALARPEVQAWQVPGEIALSTPAESR